MTEVNLVRAAMKPALRLSRQVAPRQRGGIPRQQRSRRLSQASAASTMASTAVLMYRGEGGSTPKVRLFCEITDGVAAVVASMMVLSAYDLRRRGRCGEGVEGRAEGVEMEWDEERDRTGALRSW